MEWSSHDHGFGQMKKLMIPELKLGRPVPSLVSEVMDKSEWENLDE